MSVEPIAIDCRPICSRTCLVSIDVGQAIVRKRRWRDAVFVEVD